MPLWDSPGGQIRGRRALPGGAAQADRQRPIPIAWLSDPRDRACSDGGGSRRSSPLPSESTSRGCMGFPGPSRPRRTATWSRRGAARAHGALRCSAAGRGKPIASAIVRDDPKQPKRLWLPRRQAVAATEMASRWMSHSAATAAPDDLRDWRYSPAALRTARPRAGPTASRTERA